MRLSDRALLRLHIEAVWGVQLPPLERDEVELLQDSIRPPWKLYVAETTDARIHVWRPDVEVAERGVLRLRVSEALAFPPIVTSMPGVSREVALSLSASPGLDEDTANRIARPLTSADRPLIEAFGESYADDYRHQETHPFVGVIVAGRLLSLAHSSRRTTQACELGIDTLLEARRKGYALAATIVWTQMILREGRIPLYSADAANTASLRLAAAAGYRVFARGASFEE